MVVAVEYISKEESADAKNATHGVTGILAVQGAFAEHAAVLDKLGAPWKLLRAAEDFDESIDRVILPGGESTTQGKLLRSTGLFEPIAAHIKAGKPVFGTCAGMILLAKKLDNDDNVYFGARSTLSYAATPMVVSSAVSKPSPILVQPTTRSVSRTFRWCSSVDRTWCRSAPRPRSKPKSMVTWWACVKATSSPPPSIPNSRTTSASTSSSCRCSRFVCR